MSHLLVRNRGLGNSLQGINPVIAYTIRELLLLSPGHRLRKHILKRLSQNLLLHGLSRTHFRLRVEPHGNVQKLLVQERDSAFHAPGCKRLVGPQTIVLVQFAKLADSLLVQSLGRRGLMEI